MWIAHWTESLVAAGKLHLFAFIGSSGANDGDDGDQGIDIARMAHFAERNHGGTFDVVHGASVTGGVELPNLRIIKKAGGGRKAKDRRSGRGGISVDILGVQHLFGI